MTTDPKYAYEMQRYVLIHDLSSKVTFHGSLDHDELARKLKGAHVLVVPSSYEGFGIVYLEGMGFGLPAIGTTAGAAGELIDQGVTGYLIEPEDSQALIEHLRDLQEDRDLLGRLSLNARARYLKQASWSKTAKSVRDFLYSFVH
jgi:glycosyltransferase involved in cell wall biosynthesis